ncbi:MAG TPA: YCF48-related protein [Bacteroidales bacterium]|nr:YCF48-related protein [Bacteroidales bacterium]
MLFSATLSFSQGSWEKIEVPTASHLRSVFFTDSLFGWAVGDTGTIIHTQDGGQTWSHQDAATDNHIMHVFFLNRQLGWAASWNYEGFFGTLILQTTDGGNTWTQQAYPQDNIFMNCILFQDPLNGWMGGSPHALVKTVDGGQTWAQASIDTSAIAFFPVLDIAFYDEKYGYACGGVFDIAGVTWSTSDGGESWRPIDNLDAPADEVHGLHLFDSINVIGAGGDPDQGYGVGMLRTSDGGINWDYEELSMAGNAFDIDFRNENEAWAPLGPIQKMIYSLDAGDTWTQVDPPGESAIFDIIFPDSMHGYAVGYNGAFLRYIPPPLGISEYTSNELITLEVYPVPADHVLNVLLKVENNTETIPKRGVWTLYDAFGEVKMTYLVNVLNQEVTRFSIDISDLPPGLYVGRLMIGDAELTSKKVLLR